MAAAISLRYRIVDVFSDRALAGNALCVVLDECPPELMARLAREVNLSETTYPRVTGSGSYDIRIFTPGAELPFAGHPTIGTAWCLGPGRWEQTSPGAKVTVEADSQGAQMLAPIPTFTAVPAEAAAMALGLGGVDRAWLAVAGGLSTLIVPTTSRIDDLAPNLPAVAAAAAAAAPGCANVAVVRRRDDDNLHVRVFVPGFGIPEDPGTGSAAGPIAVLAHREWGTSPSVRIHQGAEMGRPSLITVELAEDGVLVGGRVTAVAEGHFTLPG